MKAERFHSMVASFGTISKMYKNMENDDKKEIAKEFEVDYIYLES